MRAVSLGAAICAWLALADGLRIAGESEGAAREQEDSEAPVLGGRPGHGAQRALWDGRLALEYHASPSLSLLGTRLADDNRTKLAVCLIGQLSRLETESKIRDILEANAVNSSVQLFVVLETHASVFVNVDYSVSRDQICTGDNERPEDVARIFRPYYKRGLFVAHKQYLKRLNAFFWRGYGKDKPEIKVGDRLAAHFSQWTHMASCSRLVREHEDAHHMKFDAVLKIRDNTLAVQPYVPFIAFPRGDTKIPVEVKAKPRGHVDGVHDKVMLIPRVHMETALEGVLDLARAGNSGDSAAMKAKGDALNPEMMLYAALHRRNVSVWRRPCDDMPLVDGRCEGLHDSEAATPGGVAFEMGGPRRRKFCLVANVKDGHPENVGEFHTCDPDLRDGSGNTTELSNVTGSVQREQQEREEQQQK